MINIMRLRFTKMQGIGNDFVVFDGVRQQVNLSLEQCRFLADRRFGIGCDQILLVEPPRLAGTHFHYRIFNADGSEVEQCGNGARCFARFVHDQGLTNETEIPVGTAAGPIHLYLEGDGLARVNMGTPQFAPQQIPFLVAAEADSYDLEVEGQNHRISAVSMGNPHAILQVEDLDKAPVDRLGPLIERHPRFPNRVNAGFLQILEPDHVRLRVFERGVGETLACGTGACAAVAVGRRLGLLAETVRVSLPGGDLHITWAGGASPLWMTGPAVSVFDGEIEL